MNPASAAETVRRKISEAGYKASTRRDVILEAFLRSSAHLTVDELYERARAIDPAIGYTTVWRTLKLLITLGFAVPQTFQDGCTRYEPLTGEAHHDHLICQSCGRVWEFRNDQIERMQEEIAASHQFSMKSHRMELYGICSACAKEKRQDARSGADA